MTDTLTAKIEELALVVMMLGDNDEPGLLLVLDVLRDIGAAAKGSYPGLAVRCEEILAAANGDKSGLVPQIRDFVEWAQESLKDGPANTPSSSAGTQAEPFHAWGDDISPDCDPALMVEFIEKHSLLLEDFESALLNAMNAGAIEHQDVSDDLTAFCKSYLHNIKGDAGAVGFLGIQNVTHSVEEALTSHRPDAIVSSLLLYKEWVIGCLRACADKKAPSELANPFLARFQATLSSPAQQAKPTPPAGASGASPFTASRYALSGDPEIFNEFVLEAEDHLGLVEEILLSDEAEIDQDKVNSIFRAIHSIKGGSSYFNLQETTRVSHITENLLDRARKGQLAFTQEFKEILLTYIDIQKGIFKRARTAMTNGTELESSETSHQFLNRLESFSSGGSAKQCASESAPRVEAAPAAVTTAAERQPEASAARSNRNESELKKAGDDKLEVKSFVKVDTNRLDQLIEYIGEMVISSSMLIKSCRDLLGEHETVMTNTHQLEKISRDIQEIGMSMRLIPIKGLFQKMSRLVWDTAKKIGKEIVFHMEGEDTELDRTVIDKLADPLMHMIRNSIDHGIEAPDDRVKRGKPRSGTVTVSAYHFGGSIHIKVADDGRGLDPDKILRKALEKGLVSEAAKLTKGEIFNLIFAPGFSTAEKVTDISGRGVGMDVVRRNIEAMRGRVQIESELGKGSVFIIELPLTLAIIDGIETVVGEERFIVPTLSVVEFVRPTAEMISTTLNVGEALQFRGKFLPIFRLSELYEISPRYEDPTKGIVVVAESNGELVAILLDDVVGTYSTVIKNLGQTFEQVKGLAGCAIMPNGDIGLILDIATLVQLARSDKPTTRQRIPREALTIEQASMH